MERRTSDSKALWDEYKVAVGLVIGRRAMIPRLSERNIRYVCKGLVVSVYYFKAC